MAARRALRRQVPPIQVGEIVHYEWGYDQTNCDYFQIVAVTDRSVKIRAIASEYVSGQAGWDENLRPVKDSFLGTPAMTKIPQTHDGKSWYLSMAFGVATPCAPDAIHNATYYA
jgi:hypothetical protein